MINKIIYLFSQIQGRRPTVIEGMKVEIRLLDEEVLCRGRRVTLYSRRYWVEGREVVRDVVHFGESVAIVPVKENGKIVLIRQFRAPIGRWIIEVPAGRVEEGEDWRSAATRELEEETGYNAAHVKKLASTYVSPGYSDEIVHITLAEELVYVGGHPESSEVIEIIEISYEKVLEYIYKGIINDAKTIIALLLYSKSKTY